MRETAPRRRSRKGLKAVSTVTHASASPPATITAVFRAPPSRAPAPFAMGAPRGPLAGDGSRMGGVRWRDARALCDGCSLAALGVWARGGFVRERGWRQGQAEGGEGKAFRLALYCTKGKAQGRGQAGGRGGVWLGSRGPGLEWTARAAVGGRSLMRFFYFYIFQFRFL